MKKLVFLFLTIHTALFLNGQISSDAHNQLLLEENAGSQLYVQFKAHVGRHLYTGNTFHDYLDETSYGTSLRIGWRSTGEPDWQKALNYPLYGFGVFGGRNRRRKILWKSYRYVRVF